MGCRTNGVSDYRGVGLIGCRTNGVSDYRGVGLMGCRTNGVSGYRGDPIFRVRNVPEHGISLQDFNIKSCKVRAIPLI